MNLNELLQNESNAKRQFKGQISTRRKMKRRIEEKEVDRHQPKARHVSCGLHSRTQAPFQQRWTIGVRTAHAMILTSTEDLSNPVSLEQLRDEVQLCGALGECREKKATDNGNLAVDETTGRKTH
jgi:hypothetical protein